MRYIIGVDGGGTKTEAIAYNMEGKEICRAVTGYGSLIIDKKTAVNNIIQAIEICVNTLKENELIGIYLGLAGIEAGENKKIVEKAVKSKFNTHVEIYNDAELAFYALLKGEEGILAISGTGSIALGISKGKKITSGGWGHLLGDEGSGYNIAINAYKRMIYEEELGLEKSKLTKTLLKELSIQSVQDIKGIVYYSTKDEIASIIPTIVKLAEEQEENALRILKEAGMEIALMVHRLWKKLKLQGTIKVALKGSIITKIKFVREAFNAHLLTLIESVEIIDEDVSSCKGAYYLAGRRR
ncbi:BadF/BadG/BcrA/BcrD ATPase family protein [Clostridium sp. OS1-26]|uniref:BadF/BadG/BcrA/BcrD ATPase family protein n=1 Tax=Clostridium sp. OS1-26 TaxID=3070681 RepID=UPI0027E19416|nr:BadF/BadG/BcrA/BcrD ATPase family protein [Clostridium sp. OS1-26]WML33395.1 BadF/BadG/BcrA/BcrD ATPase family protein [Clostridium sp. OS1-26]